MPIVLITGANRGIGRATALLLSQRGYTIALNYRQNHAEAQDVLNAITQRGGQAFLVKADISDEQQVEAMFHAIDSYPQTLEVLINNAGILAIQSTIEALSAERINRILHTNVTGSFLCCREAVKRMALRHGGQGGHIVNISSVAARLGAGGEYLDYAASKGALDTLTIGLAQEVARQRIRVNSVRPGYIYTGMHASGGEPDRVDRVKSELPLGRGGEPHEVAEAIAWLISDRANYVTGNFIDLAGGR